MSASRIEYQDGGVSAALDALAAGLAERAPVLHAIGEAQVARIRGRFSAAEAPDGAVWAANSPVTVARYILARGGVSTKTGRVTKRGTALGAAKRPLQGESGDLARQIHYAVDADGVEIGSSMVYAAMMHFGGTRAEFPHLWGDIPARPFLPLDPASGALYPDEQADLLRVAESAVAALIGASR